MVGKIMKKVLSFGMLIIILAAIVYAGGNEFPKYAFRLVIFSIFILVDIFYWNVIFKLFATKRTEIQWLTAFYYWLPFALLVAFVSVALIVPLGNWLPFFRIYIPGILVVAYIGKIILVMFLITGDLAMLPVNLMNKHASRRYHSGYNWRRPKAWIASGLVVSLLIQALFISGMFYWVYDFRVRQVVLSLEKLPSSFSGIKIVQISDLHLGSWRSPERLAKAIDLINAQNPDMIVFTGDLVNFSSREALPFAPVLRKLHAPLGIFAVKGNHDYGDYISWDSPSDKDKNVRDLNAFYKSIGWKLLDNSHEVIHMDYDSIVLAGVENWSASKLYGKRGNLKKALTGAKKPAFKILLSHDPTHWDAEVNRLFPDIDLTLSGHTHAMQMGWEGINSRWSPSQWKFREWAGLYEHDSISRQYLYVNRGLGTIAYPGRIGIRPEITVLCLFRE